MNKTIGILVAAFIVIFLLIFISQGKWQNNSSNFITDNMSGFSEKLDKELKTAGKTSELFVYEGDDHNLAANFNTAIQRSVEFFDKFLK